MKVQFGNDFKKLYRKSPKKIQTAFDKRLKLFMKDRASIVLHDHALVGKLRGYRSINVSGDWRAIYKIIREDEEIVHFTLIGTHSQLYK